MPHRMAQAQVAISARNLAGQLLQKPHLERQKALKGMVERFHGQHQYRPGALRRERVSVAAITQHGSQLHQVAYAGRRQNQARFDALRSATNWPDTSR